MGLPGRKSAFEEIEIAKRYADLAPKAFGFVLDCLENGDKIDKKWAADWLKNGYIKMIPQITKVSGNEDDQTPIPISLLGGATQKKIDREFEI